MCSVRVLAAFFLMFCGQEKRTFSYRTCHVAASAHVMDVVMLYAEIWHARALNEFPIAPSEGPIAQ